MLLALDQNEFWKIKAKVQTIWNDALESMLL